MSVGGRAVSSPLGRGVRASRCRLVLLSSGRSPGGGSAPGPLDPTHAARVGSSSERALPRPSTTVGRPARYGSADVAEQVVGGGRVRFLWPSTVMVGDDEDVEGLRPSGGIVLVEGNSFAPADLAAAGFSSLRALVGSGNVVYRGIRDDHHVFEHGQGDFYEPVSRQRAPGPRTCASKATLHLGAGVLIASFTDSGHVWVSTGPAGLVVEGSTVSFSFHHHRQADGRWVASAWDPGQVRPRAALLAMAPLVSVRHIARVILPDIAAALADLSGDGPLREVRLPPAGPHRRSRAGFGLSGVLVVLAVVALAVVGLGWGSAPLASAVAGGPTMPSVTDAAAEPVPVPVQPQLGHSAPGTAAAATPGSLPGLPLAVPAHTGAGRRVVYCNSCQRVWLVEADESVVRTYPVSGRQGVPRPGTYAVRSKSEMSGSATGTRLEHMVRFVKGRTLWIGFHAIPVGPNGPIQSLRQLGQPLSLGCVRQAPADAKALWEFTAVGTPVVVLT